ncbi:MAG: transporter substrate-binding domain-containing protein [Clostridiales bacterium]|nr:transporter substrate-binding domain-containing protein [Clostridiales bacterium]
MKKILVIMLVLAILAVPLTACKNNDTDELVVAMELAYPPFETTDANGEPDGISVQMAYALGEYLDRPVRIENMAWTGLIPALTTGKVDIILSSMTITEERAKTVNFSNPYSKSQLSLLVSKSSTVQEFNDLKQEGKKLAVKIGSTGHTYAIANLPEKNIVVFEKETSCVLEVSQGRADAFIYDAMTIYKNAQQYSDTTVAVFTAFQKDYEYWGMALNKNDEKLLEDVNAFIKKFQDDGEMNKLADEYLGEIKTVFDDLDLSFFFDID